MICSFISVIHKNMIITTISYIKPIGSFSEISLSHNNDMKFSL